MNFLHIVIGIPGSGKSEHAQQLLREGRTDLILSSDEIRLELTGDMTSQERNKDVFSLLHRRLFKAMREGKNVLVDATNLRSDFREDLVRWAKSFGYSPVAWVIHCDVDLCRRRMRQRGRIVPDDVFDRMVDLFKHTSVAKLTREGWSVCAVDTTKGGV